MYFNRIPFLGLVLATIVATYLVGTKYLVTATKADEAYRAELRDIPVVLPSFAPVPGQEHIDLAMALFSIETPDEKTWPTFDKNLKDRGLTKRKILTREVEVTIGPAAFENWPVLASTLAHELEVHGRQSMLAIVLLDLAGAGGTKLAERQAYMYEMANSGRFGLRAYDQQTIRETMEYFYPISFNNRFESMQNLFARALLPVTNPNPSVPEVALKN